MENLLGKRGLVGMLARFIIMITSPIWLLGLFVLYSFAIVFVAVPYWLWTGEDLI